MKLFCKHENSLQCVYFDNDTFFLDKLARVKRTINIKPSMCLILVLEYKKA